MSPISLARPELRHDPGDSVTLHAGPGKWRIRRAGPVNEDLIALAQGAGILVHHVADLDYLARHGVTGAALARQAGLHTDVTQVGGVAERARAGELILSHYLPADPGAVTDQEWAERAGQGFSGITTAGRDGLRRTLTRATSPSA